MEVCQDIAEQSGLSATKPTHQVQGSEVSKFRVVRVLSHRLWGLVFDVQGIVLRCKGSALPNKSSGFRFRVQGGRDVERGGRQRYREPSHQIIFPVG